MLGLVGVARLHSRAEPVFSHGLIGVSEHMDATVRVSEGKILGGHDRAQDSIGVGCTRDLGHIGCGGILVVGRKTIRIHKVGGSCPQ